MISRFYTFFLWTKELQINMKSFFIFSFLILTINSLKLDEYISSIEELIQDANFLEEYTKWSLKLFSTKDYIYGKQFDQFPCQINSKRQFNETITVHKLRPNDIQCVGAIGDSLTAALGAHALTPIGLFTENRGVSWAVGGDYHFEQLVTLPNILRLYNSNLKGFSTKQSLIFGKGQNSSHNGLNVGKLIYKSFK